MRILLDTHALIWLFYDTDRLSAAASDAMRNAAEVAVSIASLWEIAIKKALGKLDVVQSVTQIEKTCTDKNIAVLPSGVGALEQIQQLPDIHRDPFDRLLIATAVEEGMALVTNDEAIQRYDVETIWE